jgi:hypothetical protein
MDVGGWVPQVFYDLIGRIVPGAFLLLLCCLLFVDPASGQAFALFVFKDAGIPFTAILLAGLTVAYVTGTLLGAVGFAVWHREWSTESLNKLQVEYPVADKPGTGVALMYDSILLHEPAAGARLVKLRAEQHMCRVLIIGTLTLLFLYCWRFWPPWQLPRHLATVGGLVLVGVGAYLFDVHLTLRSRLLLLNYWHLIEDPTARRSEKGVGNNKPPGLEEASGRQQAAR